MSFLLIVIVVCFIASVCGFNLPFSTAKIVRNRSLQTLQIKHPPVSFPCSVLHRKITTPTSLFSTNSKDGDEDDWASILREEKAKIAQSTSVPERNKPIGGWTKDEYRRLQEAVDGFQGGKVDWSKVAEHVGGDHCKETCHYRWHHPPSRPWMLSD